MVYPSAVVSTTESPAPVALETHVFGPTLMPGYLMPRFYRRLVTRLANGGAVAYHPMTDRGGLGRTDRIVDSLRGYLEDARADGRQVQLAGHSLGGVVAWVLTHEYPDVVRVAELWSTPVRGTALSNVMVPVAEARFLARASRWLRNYDRPVSGPLVRSVYSTLDQLAVPSTRVCYIEGDTAENHLVSPVAVPRRLRGRNVQLHRGVADHVFLPRLPSINRELGRVRANDDGAHDGPVEDGQVEDGPVDVVTTTTTTRAALA